MSFTVERLNQEPILFIKLIAPVDPVKDLADLYRDTDTLSAKIPGTIYRLMDLTHAELTFDLAVDILDVQRRSTASTSPQSPHVKNHYVVSDDMGHFMIESLRQRQYGALDVKIYNNFDEALQSIHEAIRKNA